MKLSKASVVVISFFILFVHGAIAQSIIEQKEITQSISNENYYMFPIRPGEVNYLAGTMGELRATHFHGGIDIKTGGVEGLNVYAAADGYISRIAISTSGYGNALYILHPNGETSVYAHLKVFSKEVAKYAREQQYSQKSFSVNLFPEQNQFKVKKADIIGLSGNSGGSTGPHLHFEIRDKNQHVLDPLYANFSEIKDTISPTAQFLSINCLDINARVNGQFGNFQFPLIKNGNSYSLKKAPDVQGLIGLELMAYDRLNGVPNKNGIPFVNMWLDSALLYKQVLSKFSFAESRNILVHTNFETKSNTGRTYNRLYIPDGNAVSFYDKNLGDGIINVKDTLPHDVKISISDKYDNTSSIEFKLNGKKFKNDENINNDAYLSVPFYIKDNTLIINTDHETGSNEVINVFSNRQTYNIRPKYKTQNKVVYLWDLRKGLPDSLGICNEIFNPNFKVTVPSNKKFDFYHNWIDLSFTKRTLFDTLYLQLKYTQDLESETKELIELSGPNIPFRSNASITFHPKIEYKKKANTSIYSVRKNFYSYVGGIWKDNEITFKSRYLNTFTLLTDSVAPTIRPIRLNKELVSFVVYDKLSGINKIEAKINGKWLLMNYDAKNKFIWSEKIDESIPFSGNFILTVRDNAGNEKIFKKTFKQ